MITDEDVLEKDDMYILDQIKNFASDPEVSNSVAAAKQLVVLIDRVVRILARSGLLTLSNTGYPSNVLARPRSGRLTPYLWRPHHLLFQKHRRSSNYWILIHSSLRDSLR